MDDGVSSGATVCLGEIRDRGGDVAFGETEMDGLGDGVGAGAIVACGVAAGATVGVGLVPPNDHVFFEVQENTPLAISFSIAATVRTSPALKFPSPFVAGSVAVGAWPTGIGTYCSPAQEVISFPLK